MFFIVDARLTCYTQTRDSKIISPEDTKRDYRFRQPLFKNIIFPKIILSKTFS